MCLLTENIIPGKYGKIFSTDARDEKDLFKIKKAIEKIPGIKEVVLNQNVFPVEFTIRSKSLVDVERVENEVKRFGYHALPKGFFEL